MYPHPIFYWFLSVVSCRWFRVSHFRAPFGVGVLTTIPRAKFKKNEKPGTNNETTAKTKTKTKPTPRTETATKQRNRRYGQNKGYPIGYTNRADYRYGRNAIHRPIPQLTPATSGVITCMGVTLFLALYSSIPPYAMSSYEVKSS